MKAVIYISGRITKGETLIDVVRQFKSFENPSELEVNIKSFGGNKEEGDAVYSYLKNIDEEIPVTTIAEKAFSIAAKIFSAGRYRLVDDKEEVLGVHFARVNLKKTYVAEELDEMAKELFSLKKEFIDFYSDLLNIDKDTIESILDNETMLSGEKAVEIGFATGLSVYEEEIVAELIIDNQNKREMKTKKNKKNFLKKLSEAVEALFDGEEIVAELVLQDSSGTEIVFEDLEEGDVPKVGDSAKIDGKAVEDGSFIMPSLEDSTVVFEGGKVSEVKQKEDVEEEDEEVVAEEIKEVVTWSVQAASTSFEEGEVLMLEGWGEDSEPYAASAGEWKLMSGKTIVTDASGVIVKVKSEEEAITVGTADENEEVEAEFDIEGIIEKVVSKTTKKVKAELTAEFEGKISEKNKEIKDLKAKQGSKEFVAEVKEVEDKPKKGSSRAADILAAAKV